MPSPRTERGPSARHRVATAALRFAIVSTGAVGATACTPSHVYEPAPWTQHLSREVGFDSAVVLDATRVVFSTSDGSFRPVAPDPLWGRGPREFVRDVKCIGVLDAEHGDARIVLTDVRERVCDGNGDFAVVDARGSAALVFRERSTERGVLMDPGGWHVLDLATGALAAVDVDGALLRMELVLVGAPRLADGRGALCVPARKPAQRSSHAEFAELIVFVPPAAPPADASQDVYRAPGEPWLTRRLGIGRLLAVGSEGLAVARPSGGEAVLIAPRTGAERALDAEDLAALVAGADHGPIEIKVVGDGARLRVSLGEGRDRRRIEIDVGAVH